MKRNKVFMICTILCLIIFTSNSYAEVTITNSSCSDGSCYSTSSQDLLQTGQESKVCFPEETAKKLVVEIEQCRIINKNIINYYKSNVELTKQIALLKTEVELLKQKFEIAENLLKTNEQLYKQKEEVLNNELKEAKKPRWPSMFISGGIGAVLALLLAISI